jgi:hypothetical protein
MESGDVRLARIEEGMVRVHERISANHTEVMKALGPFQETREDVTVLKRDRFWLFTICGFSLSMAGYAFIEHVFK